MLRLVTFVCSLCLGVFVPCLFGARAPSLDCPVETKSAKAFSRRTGAASVLPSRAQRGSEGKRAKVRGSGGEFARPKSFSTMRARARCAGGDEVWRPAAGRLQCGTITSLYFPAGPSS